MSLYYTNLVDQRMDIMLKFAGQPSCTFMLLHFCQVEMVRTEFCRFGGMGMMCFAISTVCFGHHSAACETPLKVMHEGWYTLDQNLMAKEMVSMVYGCPLMKKPPNSTLLSPYLLAFRYAKWPML